MTRERLVFLERFQEIGTFHFFRAFVAVTRLLAFSALLLLFLPVARNGNERICKSQYFSSTTDKGTRCISSRSFRDNDIDVRHNLTLAKLHYITSNIRHRFAVLFFYISFFAKIFTMTQLVRLTK